MAFYNPFSRKDINQQNIIGWDILALFIVGLVLVMLTTSARDMLASFDPITPHIKINTQFSAIPAYALHSIFRMILGLVISLILSFTFGAWAAKSARAEKIIIPAIDVLQSVPILGFLAIFTPLFLNLVPGTYIGPELAALLAIVSSQAWNMILSFYQSLKTVPQEWSELAASLHLSKSQYFWRIEVPYALPSLVWNMMLSLSAAWFFVVASEVISVNNQKIMLPGIGSYIGQAINQGNIHAIYAAILAMAVIIISCDTIIFKPLLAWSDKFNDNDGDSMIRNRPLILRILDNSGLAQFIIRIITKSAGHIAHKLKPMRRIPHLQLASRPLLPSSNLMVWALYVIIFGFGFKFLYNHLPWLFSGYNWQHLLYIFKLGAFTLTRIIVLTVITTMVWVPIGVWIGLRPKIAGYSMPIIQFLASFPANLLFPLMVMLILRHKLNIEIWASPLMIISTQWYILFNVISGTMALPKHYRQTCKIMQVKGWLWWHKFLLPGIMPHLITGLMTAVGGSWNASIVAEALTWKGQDYYASGLGSFITIASTKGHTSDLLVGILVMCTYVLLINRFLWLPWYNWATSYWQNDKASDL